MSHYSFMSAAWPRHISLSVGWDPEGETFFARIMAYLDRGRGELVESLPGANRRIGDLDSLERQLNRQLEGRLPGVTIPTRLRKQLLADRTASESATSAPMSPPPPEAAAPEAGDPGRGKQAIPAPAGWMTMVDMQRCGKYVTPRSPRLRHAILDLRRQKRDDYRRQGVPDAEAERRADGEWASYYARQQTADILLYVSPRAVAELEENGSLRLRLPMLPEDRKHWIPATMSRGCMAVNLDTKPHCLNMLLAACERILARHARTAWTLPADETHRLPAGDQATADVMGRYANHSQAARIYFDPRMAPYIRREIGLPAALPRNRRHWIPTTSEGCSRIGVERRKDYCVAMRRICGRFLADPGEKWWLPHDKNRREPSGWYPAAAVIGIYTNTGKPPVYYFDPRLAQEGIITKQAIKAEAGALTPEDLDAPDPGLEEERALLKPPRRLSRAAE